MDLFSLAERSSVYVIRKKPFQFETGTVKSKVSKQQNLNPYMPQQQGQAVDVVVTVDGKDEVVPNVPSGVDVVNFGNNFYASTPESAQQAIANLMQQARTALDEKPYWESVLEKGEPAIEMLNPQYAEGKRQARTIKELQDHVDAQEKKLDEILSFMRDLSSPSTGNKSPKTL